MMFISPSDCNVTISLGSLANGVAANRLMLLATEDKGSEARRIMPHLKYIVTSPSTLS